MSTRERLEQERDALRDEFKKNPSSEIERRGKELGILIKNLCATCHEEPRTYNEFYCSKGCETDYYGKPKNDYGHDKLTVDEMRDKWKHAKKHYNNLVPDEK